MVKTNRLKFNLKDWFEHEKDDFQDDFFVYPKRKFLIALFALFVLFYGIYEIWSDMSSTTVHNLDLTIETFVKMFRNPLLSNIFYAITFLGSQYFIVGMALLIIIPLFLRHRKKAAVTFFLTLLMAVILVMFLKSIIGRDRPNGCLVKTDCYSFPSGHATLAFYFYGIVSYLIARFVRIRKKLLVVWIIGVAGLVILIAISRIYLGFHFFSDIVAGFLIGGICWLLAAIMIDIFYNRYQ